MPVNKPATPNALDYLTRALQLLEKPRPKIAAQHSWIINGEAWSDSLGTWVAPESEQADAWCTIGVIKATTKYDPNPVAAYTYCLSILNLANPAYIAYGQKNAQAHLNDRASSFEEVRTYFQRAIAYLQRHSN